MPKIPPTEKASFYRTIGQHASRGAVSQLGHMIKRVSVSHDQFYVHNNPLNEDIDPNSHAGDGVGNTHIDDISKDKFPNNETRKEGEGQKGFSSSQ